MEVKSVFMDLVEGKKNGNTWRLESEAFKDPIEIKIGYDNHELQKFMDMVKQLQVDLNNKDKEIYELKSMLEANKRVLEDTQKLMSIEHENVKNLVNFLSEDEKEIKSLYKAVADAKMNAELFSGTILKLQEKDKEIEKKITRVPMVFRGATFVSGHESVALGTLDLPSGDYLMLAKYNIGEHNEYVSNKDDMVMDKIHAEENFYMPMYKLEGGTALDKPTATIHREFTFIPC